MVEPDAVKRLEKNDNYQMQKLSSEEAEKEWLNSLHLQIHRIPHNYPLVWISNPNGSDKLCFQKNTGHILSDEEIRERRALLQ